MSTKRRKFWGWGMEDVILPIEEQLWIEKTWAERLQVQGFEVTPPPSPEEITLRKPRISIPSKLSAFCNHDHYERLVHSYGKSLADSARIFNREYPNPPDAVATPRNEQEITELLEWASGHSIAVTPYGGGSSVVGGIEPTTNERYEGTISVDMSEFNKVLEIDTVSEAALIQAGCLGPALESQLKPSGLTLRFFPQSFEYSSLGGWIATRAGGHFATGPTHIDDLVENVHMITPAGAIDTRRLPGSGAGPSPDRALIGSEGIYGIITQAWMRVRKRPTFRAATTVAFKDYWKAVDAVRVISQSGLFPANLRLLDAEEAGITGASDGTASLLVLSFESADHPLEAWLNRAIEICNDFGGVREEQSHGEEASHRRGAAGAWRNKFVTGCYFRENLTARGIIRETFETAITWDRFPALHAAVKKAALEAGKRVTGNAIVSMTCRFTHVYPDGPAPYFTLHVLGNKEKFLEEFLEIKKAVADAMVDAGGTVTHHHAVGRLHRPQYDRQLPGLSAQAMRATKQTLDPKLVMNPGILID